MIIGWFLGFTEGEGSFFIHIGKNKEMYRGLNVRTRFSLSQKETCCLHECKIFLIDNNIESHLVPGRTPSENNLIVIGTNQCLRLGDLLLGLDWHTRKRVDFDIWYYAVTKLELIGRRRLLKPYKRVTWTDQDLIDFMYLQSQMNLNGKQRQSWRKYDYREYSKEWGVVPGVDVVDFVQRRIARFKASYTG